MKSLIVLIQQKIHYVNKHGNIEVYTSAVGEVGPSCDTFAMRFRFAEFRRKAGLTQREVAARLDISPGLYNQLENGKRRMNETYLAALAELYGVSPVELIHDGVRSDPLFQELERSFRKLSPEEQRMLVASARGMVAGRTKPD